MSLSSWFIFCRFVHFSAVMLMFGISVFTALLTPQQFSTLLIQRTRPLLILVSWSAALSAVAMLLLQAGQMGDGWQDTLRPPVIEAVLSTSFGDIWRWHLGLSLLSILALLTPSVHWRSAFMLFISFFLLVSLALIGHVAIHSGLVGLAHRSNHALHLLSAGYWFGSLVPLLICLRFIHHRVYRQEAIVTLIRFSTWGHLAVALVIATGVVNNLFILGQWPFDLTSLYQRYLLIKVILVALMVLVALCNRYIAVPAMSTVPKRARGWIIIACWSEMALGLFVLLLVSIFATYQPV